MNSKDAVKTLKSTTYIFGEYCLEAENLLLLRDSEVVPLAPKAVEVLLTLIESSGKLITKQEILDKVWADTFVEEANLTHHISALRKALGEDKNGRKFIETIPRRGYRFVAPITEGSLSEITFNEKITARIAEEIEIDDEAAVIEKADSRSGSVAALPEAVPGKTDWRQAVFLAVAAAILITAATAFGFYKFLHQPPMEFRAGKLTKLTSTGKTKLAAVSRDGKFAAHVQENGDEESLWIRQIAGEGGTQIIAPAKTTYKSLNFSPDGNQLYYIVAKSRFRGTLFQTSALGGQTRKITDDIYLDNGTNGVGFSPNGKQLAFVRMNYDAGETSIVITDADGGGERVFISRQKPTLLFGLPVWSPDERFIACPLQEPGVMNVLLINLADGTNRKVSQIDLSVVTETAWLPDSRHLLVVAENEAETPLDQIYQMDINDGIPHRIGGDFNNYESVQATADGRVLIALRTVQDAHLWTVDDAGNTSQITTGAEKYDGIYGIGWLTDGKIIYEALPGGKQKIISINADGGNQIELAAGGFGAASPDGRILVYQKVAFQNGRISIGLYSFDTGELVEKRLTEGLDVFATFSPGGKSIIFTRWGDDTSLATLWRIPAIGGEPVQLTKFQVISHAVSPDGKLVACAVWRGGKKHIVVVNFEDGAEVKDLEIEYQIQDGYGKRALQWTADSNGIYLIRDRDGVSNIWRQPLDGGAAVQVTNFSTDLIFNFAFSPAGRLVLSRGAVNRDVVMIENTQ